MVLVHAGAEVADVGLTGGVLPRGVGRVALVQTVVHGLALGRSLGLGLGGGAGTTAEEATDSVADGGSDSDTTGKEI